MKKLIILLILVVFAFLFMSCNSYEVEAQPSKENSSSVSESASAESESNTNKTYDLYISYMSPEECVNYATDIIKGKCINITESEQHIEYEFEVIERLLGDEKVERLIVSSDFKKDRFSSYKDGEEYYLILSRRFNVYLDADPYADFMGAMYAPSADIPSSTFCGEPLTEHTDAKSLSTEKEFVDYLVSLINKRDPELNRVMGAEYMTETDTESVVTKSDYIFKVKIKELVRENRFNTVYYCEIISTLKGEAQEGDIVEICFFHDTVAIGEEYILALTSIGGEAYAFSSKGSLFSIDDLDEIQKYLDN